MDAQFRKPSFSDWDWNNGNVLNRRRNEKKRGIVRWLNLQAISVHKQCRRLYSFSELVLASPYVFFFSRPSPMSVCPSALFLFLTGSLISRLGLHGGLESNIWAGDGCSHASTRFQLLDHGKELALVLLHLLNSTFLRKLIVKFGTEAGTQKSESQ